MTVYVDDPDFVLHVGDVRDVLASLPDGSVNCVVTSPPYWGLRDYGTGLWDGGDPDCDHAGPPKASDRSGLKNDGRPLEMVGQNDYERAATVPFRDACGKCGASRVDQQLGLEATPDLYVDGMVAVFREVRRVLRADGTCWLNLGDSYASNGPRGDTRSGFNERYFGSGNPGKQAATAAELPANCVHPGLKPKDLVGIPWRVAFALQADGWWLRSDIVWAKPNPMPESVTDRPTKSHEYVFLLTKSPRYWFDQEAVREPHARLWDARTNGGSWAHPDRQPEGSKAGHHSGDYPEPNPAGRNVRSVWEIATQPYSEAHFATFPEELVRRCLLAGCPEWVCGSCGAPRERIVERRSRTPWEERKANGATAGSLQRGYNENHGAGMSHDLSVETETVGWSDCGHNNWTQGTVLDPFMGSGTTALVARRHGRRAIGIELNREYADLAARRLQQLSLLA